MNKGGIDLTNLVIKESDILRGNIYRLILLDKIKQA